MGMGLEKPLTLQQIKGELANAYNREVPLAIGSLERRGIEVPGSVARRISSRDVGLLLTAERFDPAYLSEIYRQHGGGK
jgi:hypothetical protein